MSKKLKSCFFRELDFLKEESVRNGNFKTIKAIWKKLRKVQLFTLQKLITEAEQVSKPYKPHPQSLI